MKKFPKVIAPAANKRRRICLTRLLRLRDIFRANPGHKSVAAPAVARALPGNLPARKSHSSSCRQRLQPVLRHRFRRLFRPFECDGCPATSNETLKSSSGTKRDTRTPTASSLPQVPCQEKVKHLRRRVRRNVRHRLKRRHHETISTSPLRRAAFLARTTGSDAAPRWQFPDISSNRSTSAMCSSPYCQTRVVTSSSILAVLVFRNRKDLSGALPAQIRSHISH